MVSMVFCHTLNILSQICIRTGWGGDRSWKWPNVWCHLDWGASIRQFSLIWWRFQADSTTGVQLSHEASSTHATNFNYISDIYQLLDHIWRVVKLQQDNFQKFVSDLCQAVTSGGASEFIGLTWQGAERWSGNKHHCTFEQFSPDPCLIDWSWWLIFDADDW